MPVKILKANEVRNNWRDIVDKAHTGEEDIVVERYGKPMVAVIPYEDYLALEEQLDDLRATRRAAMAYVRWKENPADVEPYSKFREALVKEGRLDE